mmetsp:Transcript_11069/g.17775  ORF Transcript_11069/g.17775 Transcript_11069/m.17775 type:complete len:216 (+) Transcript_11069:897-1544(+)
MGEFSGIHRVRWLTEANRAVTFAAPANLGAGFEFMHRGVLGREVCPKRTDSSAPVDARDLELVHRQVFRALANLLAYLRKRIAIAKVRSVARYRHHRSRTFARSSRATAGAHHPANCIRAPMKEYAVVEVVLRLASMPIPNRAFARALLALPRAIPPVDLPWLDARQKIDRELRHVLCELSVHCNVLGGAWARRRRQWRRRHRQRRRCCRQRRRR